MVGGGRWFIHLRRYQTNEFATHQQSPPQPRTPHHIKKGFRRLSRHLAAYSGLKALWLDSNGLATLSFASSSSSHKQQGHDDDEGAEADPSDPDQRPKEEEGEGGGPLHALSQLRCLYLQNNLLARLGGGLRGLTALVTLDIRCVGCFFLWAWRS